MSDTPRTDAHNWHDGDYDDPLHAFYDFACILERELNAATSEIERLRKSNLQLREGAEEQKQRIKRLEEVGDKAVLNSYLPDRLAVWNKAKEDKL